jgi:uncharacterized protein (TIGR02246 family)
MQQDEQAIRQLVDTWMSATRKGDLTTVLTLMDDEVIFLVPGKEPFGKEEFAANSEALKDVRIEGTSDIQEIKVIADWAWMRNFLKVRMTSAKGEAFVRSGSTLTILRKNDEGRWVVMRDANLLTAETK